MIIITNSGERIYGCGAVHPRGTRSYPDYVFTSSQIDELRDMPQLTVEQVGLENSERTVQETSENSAPGEPANEGPAAVRRGGRRRAKP